jgi:pyridoxal phosphate enzyme (YggS family)
VTLDPRRSLAAVRERIAAACGRAGREPSDVTLIAVSKTFPADAVRAMMDAGQTVFGENRVQEALTKIDAVGPGPAWHLIGSLQRNKARHVVGRFALIHAVDSATLAAELDRRATGAGVVQPVLIQVRQGGETTKSGVDAPDLPALVDDLAGRPGLDLHGLMTIPPPADVPEDNRGWFAELRALRDREASRTGLALPHLSMGMTDDFEVAVEEGATLVRVGRALFGERG